jgi:hypothetical protein
MDTKDLVELLHPRDLTIDTNAFGVKNITLSHTEITGDISTTGHTLNLREHPGYRDLVVYSKKGFTLANINIINNNLEISIYDSDGEHIIESIPTKIFGTSKAEVNPMSNLVRRLISDYKSMKSIVPILDELEKLI